jgi:FkbM family methyltransferase
VAGYLNENYKRVLRIKLGYSFKDCLKLTNAALLEFTPSHVRKGVPKIDYLIQKLTNMSFCNLVLKSKGVAYPIPDQSGVGLICGDSEDFMEQYFTPQEGDVVLDVGANIGKYTLSSAKTVGKKGLVIAVEPNADNCVFIKKGLKLNKFSNVLLYESAAYNRNCEKIFYTGIDNQTNSLKYNFQKGASRVACRTIDSILEEARSLRTEFTIDWVKIDTEGAELEVLQGMTKTLSECSPRLIIEVWVANKEHVDSLLKKYGYNVKELKSFNNFVESFKSFTEIMGDCCYYYCWKNKLN